MRSPPVLADAYLDQIYGYTCRKRQFQTQENGQWIQLRRLIGHVGRAVDRYLRVRLSSDTEVLCSAPVRRAMLVFAFSDSRALQEAEPDPDQPTPRLCIGTGGLTTSNVFIIGVIHVSHGSWMPILQLAYGLSRR